MYLHSLITFRLKTELAQQKSQFYVWITQNTFSHAVISTDLSILMKMYFKYRKYMQIVFQLQHTNYFC